MKDIKLEDILKLKGKDIIELNKSDLLEYTRIASNRASRRADRLREYLENDKIPRTSISEQWLSKGLFSYNKNMTLNELRHKLATAKTFLSLEGSRVGGQKKIVEDFAKRLGLNKNEITKDLQDKLWEVYNKVKDVAINKYMASDQLQKEIYNMLIEDKTPNKVVKKVMELSKEIYEKESLEDFDDDGLDI